MMPPWTSSTRRLPSSKTPDLQTVVTGGDATFTITVTNTGDTHLTDVTVVDPQAPACDTVVASLDAGDSYTYSCDESGVVADFTNSASVSATDPIGNPVDVDTAQVNVIKPSIEIQKIPDLQTIPVGGDATFTITVTNTGPVAFTDVAVSDPLAPDCDNTIGDLAIGASVTYSCTMPGLLADIVNTATVNGDDPIGNPWTDSDTADVDVIAPDIQIDKTPDNQSVPLGDTATFTITVTNTGDVDSVQCHGDRSAGSRL